MRLSKVTAEQAEARNTIEQKRYAFARDGVAPQLAMKAIDPGSGKQRFDMTPPADLPPPPPPPR